MNVKEMLTGSDNAAAGPTVYPCPFCGYDDVEIEEVDKGLYAVICPECECTGPVKRTTVEDAIAAWNTNDATRYRRLCRSRLWSLAIQDAVGDLDGTPERKADLDALLDQMPEE